MSPARATKLRFTLWTAAALMAAIGGVRWTRKIGQVAKRESCS